MILYALSQTFQRFRRAPGMTILTIIIIAGLLYIFGLFMLITLNLNRIISDVRERIEMVVYLEDGLQTTQTDSLMANIRALPGIDTAVYFSKEDNLLAFKNEFAEKSQFLDAIETNPLPASIQLSIHDDWKIAEKLTEISDRIRPMNGVESIQFGGEWVARLDRLVEGIEYVDLILGILIAVGAVFIISNTIKLTVFARKDAIGIMRLVGATDFFIRLPIVIEGAIEGVLGGGLSVGLLILTHHLARSRFPYLLELDHTVLITLALLAALLGAGGSFISMRKFLRD